MTLFRFPDGAIMELHQLRTFVAVAEEGHLTRAAERLFVSQPAVSSHIKALEGELGVPLFHRTPRGMTLTMEGERLLGRARRLLEDADLFLGEARGMSGDLSGQVAFGINTDSTFLRVGEISARMRRDYPGISLSLVNSNSWDIVRDVRRGVLDAGFAYGGIQGEGVLADVLVEAPFRVVGPAGGAERIEAADWAGLAAMPWVWMADNCPFLDILERQFAGLGRKPRICVEADHEDILRALVVAGEGLTLLREDEALAGRDRGQLAVWPGPPLDLPLSFVWREARRDEPVLRALRDVVAAAWG
jgi:DNA-binding transcriptional LysR family regulator